MDCPTIQRIQKLFNFVEKLSDGLGTHQCISKSFDALMNSNVCNPGTTQGNTTTTVKNKVKSVFQYIADNDYDVNTFNEFSNFSTTCN